MGVHSFSEEIAERHPSPTSGIQRVIVPLRYASFVVSAVALLLASLVMTYGVAMRYFAKVALVWQDEVCIFLLVGATFMSAASVQARRGHVGIEAIAGLLPPIVNRVRFMIVDVVSFLFCTFFAWKSWGLLHEAWVEGQTSYSAWSPPMWIPYGLMTLGMILLTVQILAQVLEGIVHPREVR